jgi:3'(2'), 5'-bisphosphate nucleotidase
MINLTCQDNETLDRILAVTRAVGWGGAKILQSYYRGEQDLAVNKKKIFLISTLVI